MFYKKISVIMLIMLAALSGVLFGCGQVNYDNLSLTLSKTEITLYLNEELDEYGDPVDASQFFTATVEGAEEGVLTDVSFSQTNSSVVSIQKLSNIEDITTIKVTPISAGYSEITITTNEGSKTQSIGITVIEEISGLEALEGYVMPIVKGESKQVSALDALVFSPSTTNQKEVTYSINGFYTSGIDPTFLENIEGVEITSDGVLSIDEASAIDAGTICEIEVTSSHNAELVTTIDAKVIETIESFEVSFADGFIFDNRMSLATNRTEYSTATAVVETVSNLSYNIKAVIGNPNIMSAMVETDLSELTVYGLGSGITTIYFVAYLVDYPEYQIATEEMDVYIAEYPEQVVVNGIYNQTDHRFPVYDYYSGGVLGQEMLLEVNPIGAFNRNMILKMSQADVDSVSVYFADGTKVAVDVADTTENEGEYLASGTTIYVKANESGRTVMLQVESAGSSEKVDNLELDLSKGIESFTVSTGESLETEITGNETVDVNVSPSGAVFDGIEIYSTNTSVVTLSPLVEGSVSDLTFDINPVGPGSATVVIRANNGVTETIDVNVYVNLTDISLSMESPEENSEVGQTTLKDDSIEGVKTLESATIAIGAGLFLDVVKHPENSTIKSVTYSALLESGGIATDYVSVNSNGYMSVRAVANEPIIVTATVEDYSGAVYTESFELFVYIPIQSLTLNITNASLLASSTVGYYDLDESTLQLSAYIAPVNATFNYDDITWSSSNWSYADVVDGLVSVDIPEFIDSSIVEIKVEVVEFSRRYIQTCLIEITKPEPTESITIRNVDTVADYNYLYFDGRDGLGESFEGITSFKIDALAYPLDATNTNLRYEYVRDEYDTNPQDVVLIREDGTVVPMRAGIAEIYVIAEDSYDKDGNFLDESGNPINGLIYEVIKVKVADGLSEETAIEVASVEDFVAINNTNQSLGLYYVLSESINFSNTEFRPIGLLDDGSIFEKDGEKAGFYGYLSGSLTIGNTEIKSRIYGINLSENELYDVNDDNIYSPNVTDAYYLGVFAYNSGTITDLDVEILDLSSSYIPKGSDNNAYIGGLIAHNAGIVENIQLSLKESYIKTVHINNYVGSLVGYNNELLDEGTGLPISNIVDVKVYGNLHINQKISTNPSTVAVGGIAGYNAGVIDGGFDFYAGGVMLGTSGINSVMNITVENKLPKIQGIGGVVGINAGTVQSTSSECKIVANADKFEIDEVVGYGGIAGIVETSGLVDASYVSGSIYAPENVGGIVGRLNGIVSNSIVEILDDKADTVELLPAIVGYNYVGGIAGRISASDLATNGKITHSYVRGYVSRSVGTLYSGDIMVVCQPDIISDIYVGGVAGFANIATINNSYAHLNIVVTNDTNISQDMFVGGILGSTDGVNNVQISNVYSRGNVTQTLVGLGTITDDAFVGDVAVATTLTMDYSYTTLAYVDGNLTDEIYYETGANESAALLPQPDWTLSAAHNSGYPILTDINGNAMVVDVPDSITITVDASFEDDMAVTAIEMENTHYRVSDSEAVLYYYVEDGTDDVEKNMYALTYIDDNYNGLVTITPTPAATTTIRAMVEISDESIVLYDKVTGLLRVFKEGVVTIKVIPLLNKAAEQEFTVYVVKPVIDFNQPADVTINKDSSKRIYPEIDNGEYELNGNIEIKYEVVSGDSASLEFDNYDWVADEAYIPYGEAHILEAIAKDNLVLNATPVIYINGIREELDYLTKVVNIEVTEGVSSLELSLENASISLQDILTIEATAVTDIPDDAGVDYTQIVNGSIVRLTGDTGEILDTPVDASGEIDIDFNNLQKSDNTLKEEISIEIINKNSDIYNYIQTYQIIIEANDVVDAVAGAAEYPVTLTINIIPQELFRMDLDYYAYGQRYKNSDEVRVYNPNEMPSDSILAGEDGILQIGLFPNYANIDYVDLTTSLGEQITLLQQSVAKVDADGSIVYDPINPEALAIDNGIRLSLNSNISGETLSFDGNLYARILIPANASIGSDFKITATAYYKSGEMALITSKNLEVEMPSSIEINYNGERSGYYAVGTVQTIGVALAEWSGDIDWEMTVDSIETNIPIIEATDAQLETLDTSGTVVQDGSYSSDYVFNTNNVPLSGADIAIIKYSNINYKLYVKNDYGVGKEIVLTAEFVKMIDNKAHLYKSSELTLTTVLYSIQEIDVRGTNSSDVWVKAYGGRHNLEVNTIVVYNEDVVGITDSISSFEDTVSTEFDSWYTRSFEGSGYTDTTLALGDYANYNITQLVDAPEYIRLQPTVVTSGDFLVAKIKFAYVAGLPSAMIEDLAGEENAVAPGYTIMTKVVNTEFYLKAGENSAIPVASEADLLNMYAVGSYRLDADIILENWTPLDIPIKYFDGNSHKIIIKSFDENYINNIDNASSAYFGLFEKVYESMTLVNLNVVYDSAYTDGTTPYENVGIILSNYSYVAVGGIAGYNEGGVVYNSSTEGRINLSVLNVASADVYFGGLIGENASYITNSRSYMNLETTYGYIGGLVGANSGVIASSFYKTGEVGYAIKNTSESTTGSGVGGVAAINKEDSVIRYSYVEGYSLNTTTHRFTNGGITSNGSIGGFVYRNDGLIEDSYSNIEISTQELASGFAYDNTNGVVKNSYSASKIQENNDAQSPFIGKDGSGFLLSEDEQVINCYYLEGAYPNASVYASSEIGEVNFNTQTSFAGFKFDTISGTDISSVWVMANDAGILAKDGGGVDGYARLQTTLVVAESSKELDGYTEDETGFVEYKWKDSEGAYADGTPENPIIITSAEDYNLKMTADDNFRVVRDFSFGGEYIIPATYDIGYAGSLEGNGMTIGTVTVNTSASDTPDAITEIGMFKLVLGTIKNLNLDIVETNASNVETVGILAGRVEGGRIYNVKITTAEEMVVQGRNIVGGIAGIVKNGSILCDISVQAAVSSGYRNNMGKYIGYYIYNEAISDNSTISYAGPIAGIVESTSGASIIEVENISVHGDSTVMSENAGGMFGLFGNNSTAKNLYVEVVDNQIIRGEKVSGGIAAENRGIIENANVDYTAFNKAKIQEAYDNAYEGQGINYREDVFYDTSSVAVGGIIGFNNGGDLTNSYSGIDVRNQFVDNAGGLVGISSGGTISNSIADGSVRSLTNIGGAIGLVSNKESLYADSGYFEATNTQDALVSKSAVVSGINANNLWLDIDEASRYSYQVEEIVFKTRVGGIIGAVDKTVNEDIPGWTLTISECSNIADINGYHVGGIVGSNENGDAMIISTCYNSGNISGVNAGGILGSVNAGSASIGLAANVGDIKSMYSGINGATSTIPRYIGGIAGKMVGNISNSHNNGNISMEGDPDALTIDTFTFSIGGIAGYSDSTSYEIIKCYNVGDITYDEGTTGGNITANGGSIVGEDGTINSCYALENVMNVTLDDILTISDDGRVVGNTREELLIEGTYIGFGFGVGWDMPPAIIPENGGNYYNDGYPMLTELDNLNFYAPVYVEPIPAG